MVAGGDCCCRTDGCAQVGWLEMEELLLSGPSLDIFRWLVLDTDTGVGLLAEGAGHLLKTGSERMGGEENRVGAQMRAAKVRGRVRRC